MAGHTDVFLASQFAVSSICSFPGSCKLVNTGAHTIRVLEESAVGYNNALVELLNRFGVTP